MGQDPAATINVVPLFVQIDASPRSFLESHCCRAEWPITCSGPHIHQSLHWLQPISLSTGSRNTLQKEASQTQTFPSSNSNLPKALNQITRFQAVKAATKRQKRRTAFKPKNNKKAGKHQLSMHRPNGNVHKGRIVAQTNCRPMAMYTKDSGADQPQTNGATRLLVWIVLNLFVTILRWGPVFKQSEQPRNGKRCCKA